MKHFTRFFTTVLLLVASLAPAFATTFTVTVGNNFYSPNNVPVLVGDVVRFVWQAGVHPTVSETGYWQPFTPSASAPTREITFTTAGSFRYYCSAHGAPGLPLGQGQNGLITVSPATPTATLNTRAAGIEVSVFPNPSRGQITVQLTQKAGADYKLRLSNIIGQEVRTIALKPELTTAGLPIDLSDLRTGVYFYSLLVDGRVATTRRLVLQN